MVIAYLDSSEPLTSTLRSVLLCGAAVRSGGDWPSVLHLFYTLTVPWSGGACGWKATPWDQLTLN